MLVLAQEFRVCGVVAAELIEQRTDVLLHVCVALVVDVGVFELVIVLGLGAVLGAVLDGGLLVLGLLELVQLVLLVPPLLLVLQLLELLRQLALAFVGLLLPAPPLFL